MKGFGIEIKNDLLDPKHIESMGVAVWLYMFFIDKMTSISEEGIGKVLGGKPIKYEEVKAELGLSQRTYNRWVSILSKEGYLNMTRTPYGIVFSVNKAFKRFGKKIEMGGYAKSGASDTPVVAHPMDKSGASNKTVQSDTTKRQTSSASKGAPFTSQGAEVLKAFEAVDPKNKTKYSNKTERAACEFLLAEYGMEKVLKVIAILPKSNATAYMPTITSPYQLKEKWSALEASFRKKSDMPGRKPVIV